jgi:hypothetical protein
VIIPTFTSAETTLADRARAVAASSSFFISKLPSLSFCFAAEHHDIRDFVRAKAHFHDGLPNFY